MRRSLAILFTALLCALTAWSATPASASTSEPVPVKPKKPLIINGDPVGPAPSWAVLVLISDGSSTGRCTGTLISLQAVLTAAHCVEHDDESIATPDEVITLVGAADITDDYDGVVREVSKVEVHPQRSYEYDDDGYIVNSNFDAAVLTLAQPVSLSPMPLAVDAAGSLARGPMQAYGYGRVGVPTPDEPNGVRSNLLRVSPLGKLEVTDCTKSDEAADHICINGPEPEKWGVAPGDSGGPWVRTMRGGTVQFAITSYGAVKVPADAVGTSIAAVLPWVRGAAGLVDIEPGTVLHDPVSDVAWRVQPDGYRKVIADGALSCLTQEGAPRLEYAKVVIEQIPEAVGEIEDCTMSVPTTTTTVPPTTAAPTTTVVNAPTTTRAVAVLGAAKSNEAEGATQSGTGDSLAVTGGDARTVSSVALLMLGLGIALVAVRIRRHRA